ncbi:dienelactone hydrolase family protein [Elioraea sp.]|uniref:dienelactone hydrolase family protein n=1 Tax=Elioraea sp. TaxID=2185103 RepID=UPI003F714EB2
MSQTITLIAADGHSFSAYSAGPARAARGLVVVQEIFGVNHHMRSVCDRLASRGYAVVCPALFDRTERGVELGYASEDVARGRELRARISNEGPVADIEAAAGALPEEAKRGIIGFCWGGTIAWWGATRTAQFAASSCWYGGGIAATREETPHCPVQMHFGEKDASIPLTDVDAIRAAQKDVEIFVYANAQHGFGCDERASFDPGANELAWRRTYAFLDRHLG